jgi:RNA polymerase sigma factor (sigma-70 family)
MELSDQQLLSACRRGDEAAWEKLVHRYQRLIYTIPQRAGLDEDQAAEVFQEVFTTLLQKLDDIDRPERLQAWLVTTARRKTWRIILRARPLQQTSYDDGEADDSLLNLPDHTPLPDEALGKLEEQHRVRVALGELDERCQKLLTMLYYEAEPPPYSAIAEILGTPEGSIGPTRARCLKKLTRILKM